jgi:hypothetical protein
VWLRFASTPDVYAIQGVLGGLGVLAVAEDSVGGAMVVAMLAALNRSDGLLTGLALASGLRGGKRLGPLVAGGLATAGWLARDYTLGGADWLTGRRIALDTTDYLALYDGIARPPLGFSGRFDALAGALPGLVEFVLTPGLIMLTVPALVAALARRREGWVRATLAMWLVVPLIEVLLAPAIADHGTLYRTGAALVVGHAALAAEGVEQAAERLGRWRGYPRAFTIGVLVGSFLTIAIAKAAMNASKPAHPIGCDALAAIPMASPVFSSRPIELELRCGRPGIMITRTITAERAAEVAQRYQVRYALVEPASVHDEGSLTEREVGAVLPGWTAAGGGLWTAPEVEGTAPN